MTVSTAREEREAVEGRTPFSGMSVGELKGINLMLSPLHQQAIAISPSEKNGHEFVVDAIVRPSIQASPDQESESFAAYFGLVAIWTKSFEAYRNIDNHGQSHQPSIPYPHHQQRSQCH